MTLYTLATTPSSFALQEVNNDEVFTSLTGAVQVASRAGARWRLSLNWRVAGANLRALRAELGALNGMRHRLLVSMSKLGYVRGGTGAGTNSLLSGAHAAGATTVSLKSLASSSVGILLPGDFFSIGDLGQLVQATSILSSSGTTGTVGIWPPLQRNRIDNENVYFVNVTGVFIKTSDYGFGSEPMPSDWFCEVSAEFQQDVLA